MVISIIVPAHNAEKTLNGCYESVKNGKFEDYEFIIVENNSSDRTADIALKLSDGDPRVKLLQTTTRGPAAARNHGINFANGEYIAFIDADDYVDSFFLDVLFSNIQQESVQLSICGYDKIPSEEKLDKENMCIIEGEHLLLDFLKGNISGYVWDKLFERKLIMENEIRFSENMMIGEDRNFVFQYLKKINGAVQTDRVLYHYVQNEESICNSVFSSNRFGLVIESNYELQNIEDYSRKMIQYAKENVLIESMRYLIMAQKEKVLTEDEYNYIQNNIQKHVLLLLSCKMKIGWKIRGLLALCTSHNKYSKLMAYWT